MSTCKLSLVGSLLENQNSSSTLHLPKTIVIHDDPDEIVTIGRENSKSQVNYVLGDSSKPRVVSLLHATLRYNREDCSFSLTDQSVNGTYVNNVRVPLGGVKLETEDIVCFFHRHGANIKPGEEVEQRDIHLKYRVEIVDDNDEKEEIDDGDNRKEKTIFEAHPVVNRYKRQLLTEMNVNPIEKSDREVARGRQVMEERLTKMSREEKSDGNYQRENRVKGNLLEEECTESEGVKNQPFKRLCYWSKEVMERICVSTDGADDDDDDVEVDKDAAAADEGHQGAAGGTVSSSDEVEGTGAVVDDFHRPLHERPAVAGTTGGTVVKRERMEDQGAAGGTVSSSDALTQTEAHTLVTETGTSGSGTIAQTEARGAVGPAAVGGAGDAVVPAAVGGAGDAIVPAAVGGAGDAIGMPAMVEHNVKCQTSTVWAAGTSEVYQQCKLCLTPLGERGAYGCEHCVLRGHVFCLPCFLHVVAESLERVIAPSHVQCPFDRDMSRNIWVRDRLCAAEGHVWRMGAFSEVLQKAAEHKWQGASLEREKAYVWDVWARMEATLEGHVWRMGAFSEVEQKANECRGQEMEERISIMRREGKRPEPSAERYADMWWRMRATMELPGDTCLGCLGSLSGTGYYRGYSWCYTEHKFCVACAAVHERHRCPMPERRHVRSRAVVVLEDTVYQVDEAHLTTVAYLVRTGAPFEEMHHAEALLRASTRSWGLHQPPPT